MDSIIKPSALQTLTGIPLAFITWLLVYFLAYAALHVFDSVAGFGDSWFLKIWRELVAPGIGGYFAIRCVNHYCPRASLAWVSVIYCLPVVTLYIFSSLYIIIFEAADYEFLWGEQILGWGLALATCIGTFAAVKSIDS